MQRVVELHEVLQNERSATSGSGLSEARSILLYGVFECATVEDYDSVDGIARSFHISVKTPRNAAQEARRYTADQMTAMLADAGVTKATRSPELHHFVTVAPLLRRFVEIGVRCLNQGFREVVQCVQRRFSLLAGALNLGLHKINGREGFKFFVRLDVVTARCTCAQLTEMFQHVAAECESFVRATQSTRSTHPVMSCFSAKEIGCMLATMLDPSLSASVAIIRNIVELRLGAANFDVAELLRLALADGSLETRLALLAQALARCSSVVPSSSPALLPTVLYLDDPEKWPLAVANVFSRHGERRIVPFQLCLPVGSITEILAARESFLRRVRSGVYAGEHPPRVFCLVVPEYVSADSATLTSLEEECRDMHLRLVIIVHRRLVNGSRARFGGALAVEAAEVKLPVGDLFEPSASHLLVVHGPSRSGKVELATSIGQQHFGGRAVVSQHFLNGNTAPQALYYWLLEAGAANTAILEVGTGDTTTLQSLILLLALQLWSSQDGEAVRRVNPVVLKVHEDLYTCLPVHLFHGMRTHSSRDAATLGYQFRRYAQSKLGRDDAPLSRAVSAVGVKLSSATALPLSKAAWGRIQASPELLERQQCQELSEFLLSFQNGAPTIISWDSESTDAFFSGDDATGLPTIAIQGKTGEELRAIAYDALSVPEDMRSAQQGHVITPGILQSLIRLDMSIRCRQHGDVRREDDGITVFVGETGSGKTQLIDTYCRYRGWGVPRVIHVNTGTTDADVVAKVSELLAEFRKRPPESPPMLIFFDEFNTSPAQDTLKRIMLDRRLPGAVHTTLPTTKEGWIVVAACNPYAVLPSPQPSSKRLLKYTVQSQISPSLVGSCWRLPLPSGDEEGLIVRSMSEKCGLPVEDVEYFTRAVPVMHKFLGTHAGIVPYSLRSVSRLLRIYRYLDLITCLDAIADPMVRCKHRCEQESVGNPKHETFWAPLALAVNYYVSLPLEKRVMLNNVALYSALHRNNMSLQEHLNDFGRRLRRLYEGCEVRTALPTKLLRDDSVNETLAVTYLCVYTQTPLILLGPPGSSKTLTTFLVLWCDARKDSMHLRNIERPHYFQCSNRTTVHSVNRIMSDVHELKTPGATPVVVFDEIGIADQAAGYPLRALNQYLERSAFQPNGAPEETSPEANAPHSAFLATSNYYIDRSLMGRALVLQRNNPTVEELVTMFPQGTARDLLTTIQGQLVDVESMQSQHNTSRVHDIHRGNLTMRDVYALLSERRRRCFRPQCPCDAVPECTPYCCAGCAAGAACAGRQHLSTRRTAMEVLATTPEVGDALGDSVVRHEILKAMGRRGEKIIGKLPAIAFDNIQLSLLSQRFGDIRATIRDRLKPTGVDAAVPAGKQPTFYQSHQRPLMIAADKLSTVHAALRAFDLHQDPLFIYGKYLIGDDQMMTTTMLQLREAMVTTDRVCVMVDCEPLVDSLLDVFNGFFQAEAGPEFSVRVVLDGRSDYWPIAKDFNARCMLVTIDGTGERSTFTPAKESRFEKIYLTEGMFKRQDHAVALATLVGDYRAKWLDNAGHAAGSSAPSVVHGFHPLMLAALEGGAAPYPDFHRLLARPDVMAIHTLQNGAEVVAEIVSLVELQSIAGIVSRFSACSDHTLVLCPERGAAGDLHTLAKAADVLQHVSDALGREPRTLALRSATPDMLFDVAVRHVLSVSKLCTVMAISSNADAPLTSSQLLAVCHFVATCAAELNVKVLLFVPCGMQVHELTIPPRWRASYCAELQPPPPIIANVEQRMKASTASLSHMVNIDLPIADIFGNVGDRGESLVKRTFTDTVLRSISRASLVHVRDRCEVDRVSSAQAVAEVLEYRRRIVDLRWNLSHHFSNHLYFKSMDMDVNVGWRSISAQVAGAHEGQADGLFLLSPARQHGLPVCSGLKIGNEAPTNLLADADGIASALGDVFEAKPRARQNVAVQRLVTIARLCGAHSTDEVGAIATLKGVPLPLSGLQLSLLRHFAAPLGAGTVSVGELMRLANGNGSEATLLPAFTRACTSAHFNRIRPPVPYPQHVRPGCNPMSLPRCGEVAAPGSSQPTCLEAFIRLALLIGLPFAKALFCSEAFVASRLSAEASNAIIEEHVAHHDQRSRTMIAVRRYFGWNSAASPTTDQTMEWPLDSLEEAPPMPTLLGALRSVRDRLYAVERDCGLPYLGHYAALLHAMRHQLLGQRQPGVQSASMFSAAVTQEMAAMLTVAALPSALRSSIIGTLGPGFQAMNVLVAYEAVTMRLCKLIEYHNAFLKECDAILTTHSPSGRLRAEVSWSVLTPHHRVVSTELLDEVLVAGAAEPRTPLLHWYHLDEVLVGLPFIATDSTLLQDGGYVPPHCCEEPTPAAIFRLPSSM